MRAIDAAAVEELIRRRLVDRTAYAELERVLATAFECEPVADDGLTVAEATFGDVDGTEYGFVNLIKNGGWTISYVDDEARVVHLHQGGLSNFPGTNDSPLKGFPSFPAASAESGCAVSVLEYLQAVRERLAVPERWTQGEYARDEMGMATGSCCYDAQCWCLLGAVFRESESLDADSNADSEALDLLQEAVGSKGKGLAEWQDAPERTHAEVLAVIDAAIERAGGE